MDWVQMTAGNQMKLWLVIGGFKYEGYTKPIGIYSTEEAAKAARLKHKTKYDFSDVFEYELDKEGL